MDIKFFNRVLLLLLIITVSHYNQVRLPKLISDGMVLQRDEYIKIWGWASHYEDISISFLDSDSRTIADEKGEWSFILDKHEAGGPFEMKITATNSITIHDIMIGDVWVCSGQSNMELPMKRVKPIYEDEIANSENKFIRVFSVPQKYNFIEPQTDLESGSWKSANPESILDFSAVAYFFAKEIFNKYKIPIGLINASLGGSPAEAWMSEEALKEYPHYFNEVQRFKDFNLIKRIESNDNARMQSWYSQLRQKDEGYKDPKNIWFDSNINTFDWETMKIPGYWADTKLGQVNGVVWFRKKINIPSAMAGKPVKLNLGRIVDADSVFVNGVFIGTTSYQYPPRRYVIPENVRKEGENTIVVRVINNSGRGGFVPDKAYEIVNENEKIDLTGNWQFRLGATMNPLPGQTFVRWKPAGLCNSMLAPLFNYRIKGVIWYQGESNANRSIEYRKLFPAMIFDWRKNWGQGDFPFLFVQLPNFMEAKTQPSESNWALLREAQLKTLTLPNTGMAVAIDVGEWNDIHPLNKRDVEKRLALATQNIAYGEEDIVHSGPIYESMKVVGNKIILRFSSIGSGLVSKNDDDLKYFSICGADSQFVWGKAKIVQGTPSGEDDKVIVWNDSISNPIAVRYAWADNPEEANLYNKEGFPASPFRTDDF